MTDEMGSSPFPLCRVCGIMMYPGDDPKVFFCKCGSSAYYVLGVLEDYDAGNDKRKE
jgi:hypothetical protein